MSDPLIGRTLGKYLVQQAIGRGGMARVYRASDMVLQRSVALKVLTPALSADPDFAKRFEREAITAANLRHPAIVTIFDVGEADGLRYIAMEYISGRTLEDVLREQRRLDLPLSTAILDPVADALDFAHAAGMVHRDIKPHNILLDTDGRVVLTDFGIAIDPSEAGDRLTRTGTFMGTPEYISPEQAQAQPLTGSSDLYSLGIVAYEMLAGRVPFEGGTPQQIMAHVYQTPPLVSSVDPSQPSELDPIFARMLSKDPVQRFDKAGSFVAALRSVLQQGNMPPATREDIARLAVAADSSAGQATIAATGVPLPPADANAASPPGSAAPGMAGAAAAAGLAGQGSAAANQAYAATPPGGVQPPTGQNIRQPTGQGYSYAGGGDQFVPPPRVPRRRFYEDEGGSVPWMLLAAGAVGLVAITLVVLLSRPSGGSGGNPFVATSTATVTATETVLPSPSPEPSPSSGPSPSAVPFPTLTLVPLTPDPSEVPPPPTAEPPTAEPPTAEPPTAEPPTAEPTTAPTTAPTETAQPSLEATAEPTLEPSPEPATPTATEAPPATATPTAPPTEIPVPTAEASLPPSPPASLQPSPEPPPSTPLPPPVETEAPPGVPTPVGGGGILAFFEGNTLLLRDINNNTAEPVDIGRLEPAGPPAVSPDGKTVLVDVRDPNTNSRQILALSRNLLRPLTQGPGDNFNPSWRADGAVIVFASTRNGSADLFVMDSGGLNQRAITSGPGDDVSPTWRPDGTRIAFQSTRDGAEAIYTVDARGGPVTRVSPAGNASYRSPRWSPDGRALAFVSNRERPDGGFEVYVQQLEASQAQRVTNFPTGSTDDPAWSPDGTILAFSGDAAGSQDIYVIDLLNDQLLPSPAEDAEVDERYPMWE